MSKFFSQLVSENLIIDWAETLDWLFDDSKFAKERKWNRGYIGLFSKKVKKLKGLSDEKKFVYEKIKHTDFPNQIKGNRRKRTPFIMMSKGDGIANDLIRHIRNGIAHGQTAIYKVGNELYIEIIDFSDKTKSMEKQSAYIYIPLSYITAFHKVYCEINKSIINTKNKDRKATNKHKKETLHGNF